MSKPITLALIGLLMMHAASAEERSVSHSVWSIAQDRVTLRYVLPVTEARQLVPGALLPATEQVAGEVLGGVGVMASGSACTAIDQGYDIGRINTLSVGAELYGFEVIFQCPSAVDFVLKNGVFFNRRPGHIDFARIELNGLATQQLFSAERQLLKIPSTGAVPASSAVAYLRLGISHIMHSLDGLCFLAGLLMLARTRKSLMSVIFGLLLGYFLSWLACAGGYSIPDLPAAASMIGFLVVCIAAQAVALELRRTRLVAGVFAAALCLIGVCVGLARGVEFLWLPVGLGVFAACFLPVAEHRLPVLLPALFGFLDGQVLPGDYARLQLWRQVPLFKLWAFNSGAMLADVAVILLALVALQWLGKQKFMLSGPLIKDMAATGLAGMGTFWMLFALRAM
jgi:hypothetical protein